MAYACNGYDGALLNGLQSLPQWNSFFGDPSGAYLGLLTSGINIGTVAALTFSAPLCDWLGRRVPIYIGILFIILGAALGAAAQQVGSFIAGRILVGFGSAVCMVASPMLISEVAHPSQRSRVMTMYEPTYPLGSLIGAYITYGTSFYSSSWSWRLPVILQALLSIVQGIFFDVSPNLLGG